MTKDISIDLPTNFMPPSKTSNIRLSNITLKTWTPNDHSLWRATKKFKRPEITVSPLRQEDGNLARSN
jgi:hypothetical protein